MSVELKVAEVRKINETNDDSALRKLAQSSFEARTIFENFANRKRVHKDALLMIRVFYAFFIKKGLPLKKSVFDKVFIDLEKLGYGLVEKYPNGDMKAFMPEVSLKYIGMTGQPIAKLLTPKPVEVPVVKPVAIGTVVITFNVNGKQCQAEVPMDKVAQFTAMISN